MKHSRTILVGCLTIFLAGCVLRGTPKVAKVTPPPPKPVVVPPPESPKQLSTPQTNVELPAYQPLNPEALLTLPPPPEPVPEPAVLRRPRRTPTVVSNPAAPKPEASITPPEQAEERPAIQEIIPPEEQARLKDSVEKRKIEVNQILNSFNSRHPATQQQRNKIRYVRSFLDVAIDAANHGDLKQADAYAEKAQVLARELQSGK